jgi:nucleotide-binding universal stress UspA family protein
MATVVDTQPRQRGRQSALSRIAVGIDGFDGGNDAALLGQVLADATGADLLLTAVLVDPLVVMPEVMSWETVHKEAETAVRAARDKLAPGARVKVETDLFVARALERVVRQDRRDLLVVGSSRFGNPEKITIGRCTRQLLQDARYALAVAPKGYAEAAEAPRLRRIAVGYDGGPEAAKALTLAGRLARSAGAELVVCGVVDDRVRQLGWSRLGTGAVIVPALGWEAIGSAGVTPDWEQAVSEAEERLHAELASAVGSATEPDVVTEVRRGRPASALLELCHDVDLMVIGSRRWGPVARLLLGSTGEALLHGARCPVLLVPRPGQLHRPVAAERHPIL